MQWRFTGQKHNEDKILIWFQVEQDRREPCHAQFCTCVQEYFDSSGIKQGANLLFLIQNNQYVSEKVNQE